MCWTENENVFRMASLNAHAVLVTCSLFSLNEVLMGQMRVKGLLTKDEKHHRIRFGFKHVFDLV